MKLSVLSTLPEVEAVAEDWAALQQSSANDFLHLSHQWFLLSCRIFHAQDRPYVIVLRDEKGKLLGIAPLVVIKERYRWLKVRKITFPRNPQNPSNDFIFRKGLESVGLEVVLDHLCTFADWRMINLQMIDSDKETAARIQAYLKKRGIPFGKRNNRISPYIQIDLDWTDFWAKRSKKFKKSIRNKINKANAVGYDVEKILFEWPDPDALADMLRISSASWKRDIGTDLLTKKDNWFFYRELCAAYGRQGYITLYFLNIDAIRAAFEFHIQYKNTLYPIRADYDRDQEKHSPGSILEYEIIKRAFERGDIREYNSCGHTYKYLMNWTDTARTYINIEIFERGSFALLLYLFEFVLLPRIRRYRLYSVIRERLTKHYSHGQS